MSLSIRELPAGRIDESGVPRKKERETVEGLASLSYFSRSQTRPFTNGVQDGEHVPTSDLAVRRVGLEGRAAAAHPQPPVDARQRFRTREKRIVGQDEKVLAAAGVAGELEKALAWTLPSQSKSKPFE